MRKLIALGLMLTIASAGCGGNGTGDDPGVATARSGDPGTTASPTAPATEDPDAPLKYSKCMREQGISWFPDPENGKMSVHVPRSQDKAKFDAALEACKKWSPDGGPKRRGSPEDIERSRQFAKCMRENGVPNFPDPNADGGIAIDGDKLGTGPGQPTFDKAEKACAEYIPEGATHEKHEAGVSGGKDE